MREKTANIFDVASRVAERNVMTKAEALVQVLYLILTQSRQDLIAPTAELLALLGAVSEELKAGTSYPILFLKYSLRIKSAFQTGAFSYWKVAAEETFDNLQARNYQILRPKAMYNAQSQGEQ